MWPSVVVHEHWLVSQRTIVEMGDYAWSEHIVTVFLACINQRNPKCQNIDELRTAILQEWQQFLQERLRRLVRSMTRRVTELHNKRSGYTRYYKIDITIFLTS
jgi:chemotaxis regulatin CheY-phosphate phosphatase CheZ